MTMKNSILLISGIFLVSCNLGQKDKTSQKVDEQPTENIEPLQKDVVHIPDAIFKNYLLDNLEINTNGDDEISIAEAQAFTGKINCSRMGIEDLTGIEAFTALTELSCFSNKLTSLNVSNNTALTELDCSLNKLTALNVSNNKALVELYCVTNKLIALDVSKNTALVILNCGLNQLTSLDVRNNISLEMLLCDKNQIKELDLSKNTALTHLFCQNNKLVELNLKNNHNTQIERIRTDNNPNLRCIKVDNSTYSAANWKGELFWLDDGLIFSKDCD